MKSLVMLGGGTGGTILANRMIHGLPRDWRVSVVDPAKTHLYRPGLLSLPFGAHAEADIQRSRAGTLAPGVDWLQTEVTALDAGKRVVRLGNGDRLGYDVLVIATGTQLRPQATPGLPEAMAAGVAIDFYTLAGAQQLRGVLPGFQKGRLVVDVMASPITYDLAPLEFLFLADAFFREAGTRSAIELVLVTPCDATFHRAAPAALLERLLAEKDIRIERGFCTEAVDPAGKVLHGQHGRTLPFDLLVPVPVHGGAPYVTQAGLSDERGFVRTDPWTLAVRGLERTFALGDATDLPNKAGSVTHYQAEGLLENLLLAALGRPPVRVFDGHADLFVESGRGRAVLIGFNEDGEPPVGRYPWALGPFALLRESRLNHLGKAAFRALYWGALLPGHRLPLPAQLMSPAKRGADLPRA